ncbi:MAG: DEAD/DEAH box helicase [Micrococcales bacterium]|nr:DEAD/DEAH box helicase [Micrococcales bacterium]
MSEPSPAERYAAARRRGRTPRLTEFAARLDFGLDDFQTQACQALESGSGVLVAAPTGAGKTVVGEFAVHLGLAAGRKTFYTTPIKALSNQKYNDLVARHGPSRVGLLTGDTTVNGDAPVVVMTTEVLRNMLYAGSDALDGLGYVVMDEVHYLADRSRGAVWEEVIIHLPDAVTLVSLSATVSNAEEFGDWLTAVRGGTEVVVSEHRPVPLGQHVLVAEHLHDLYAAAPTARQGRPSPTPPVNPELVGALRRLATPVGRGPARRDRAPKGPRPRVTATPVLVEVLDRAGMLPAIVFVFSRAGCAAAVERCVASGLHLTSEAERAQIADVVERRLAVVDADDLTALGYDGFAEALSRGVAAHHAGLLPLFKETVEELFAAGLVKVVFATETLALGINMPARCVVLDQLVKWDGHQMADLTPGEYTQLTGRAGRRGIDTEGHAVVLGRPGLDPVHLAGLASRRLYPLRSSFAPTYNMAVNLVAQVGQERAREVLETSFAQHQADRAVVAQARALQTATKALEEATAAMTCHLGDIVAYDDLRHELSTLEKGRPGREGRRAAKDDAAQIADLRRRLRAHPCHACADRAEHLRHGVRRARLAAERDALALQIAGRAGTVAARFDTVCEVLRQLGYLVDEPDGLRPTAAGRWLRRIYTERDLLTAQCLRRGVLTGLDPAQLAATVSTLVYRSRHDDNTEPRVPGSPDGRLARAVAEVERAWRTVADLESEMGLDRTPPPDLGLVDAVHRWALGRSLPSVLRAGRLEAGDFVRWVKQVVDLLGQLAQAAPDPGVRATARRAMDALRRGVVAYSAL